MGSARTMGPLPRKRISPIFPPDPTSEIGKIWKHYDYPRLADPVFPVLQWGNCQSLKSSEFWISRNLLCRRLSYNYCWRIPPESPRIIKFSGGRPPGFYTFPVARSPKRGRSNHRCLEILQKSSEKSWKIAKKSIFESWGVGVCFHFLKSATTKTPKIHFRPGQPAKFVGENPPSEVRMERS